MALQMEEVRSLRRISAYVTVGGLILKAAVFFLFFRWAQVSDTGAGILRGAVAADAFTLIVLGFLDWSARGLQITAGVIFELALILAYFNREAWFDIGHPDVSVTAVSMLAFFLVMFVKVGLWGADHVLQVTGVTERASA